MNKIQEKISGILNDFKSAPILFIGSGFSRRYLGTEDWGELLKYFCSDLDYSYKKYYGEANGELPKVAELIANDFYDIWWSSDKYSDSRDKYENIVGSKKSPLKIEIANYLKSRCLKENIEELNLLKQINEEGSIDSVITTNWDTFLEDDIFKKYDVKIGQDDLLISELVGLEEIYKIHGCITEPESLVLDSEDYNDFNSKNAYLSSKLLTLFIEHPIVFLGYGLNDENIKEIIKNISKCLPKKAQDKLKNNLIFIQPIFNDNDDSIVNNIFTIDDISINRVIVSLKDYSVIYKSLLEYKRKFPLKLIKKMKKSIYEIIIDNNPKNKIIVSDIKNCEDIDGADFVVGMGLKDKLEAVGVNFNGKALNGIEYDDLLKDIILDDLIGATDKENAIKILEQKIKRKNYPVFKYIKIAGEISFSKKVAEIISKTFEDLFVSDNLTYQGHYKKANMFKSDESIINNKYLDDKTKIKLLIHLDKNKLTNLDKLLAYLKSFFINKDLIVTTSDFRKIIRMYDFLKYK